MTTSRASLTIGDLALRTGVPIATLRSWESRYGFPHPTRAEGGHRRYSESDVESVLDVLSRRSTGLSLTAAVRGATQPRITSGSVFAEVRRRHPDLAPQVLSHRTLLAVSHAIEDECCARASAPLLFGGFQRETYLRRSSGRWQELARTARHAVVFADLAEPSPVRRGTPVEIDLPHEAPLNREWFVVCDAPDLPACLVAIELPGGGPRSSGTRLFEAIWSVDPQVVRAASDVAAALADDYRPGWRRDVDAEQREEPTPASADLQRATSLIDRMLGYLDAAR